MKVGIFSGGWSTLHVWENHAADFTVDASVRRRPAAAPAASPSAPRARCRGRACRPPSWTSRPRSAPAPRPRTFSSTSIADAGGTRVAQNVITGQSFTPSQTRSYHWPWLVPARTPAGTYTVKIGVFSGDWSVLHTWDNRAATFQVGGGSPPPPGCTGGFTVGPTAASPTPVARGAVETIQTRVCSGTAASNILVDLEIYNAGGQKIAQRIFTNQSFSAGETLSYTWSYVVEGTLPSGTYTVKIGVFSGGWSVLHKWENQAATFVVQ